MGFRAQLVAYVPYNCMDNIKLCEYCQMLRNGGTGAPSDDLTVFPYNLIFALH